MFFFSKDSRKSKDNVEKLFLAIVKIQVFGSVWTAVVAHYLGRPTSMLHFGYNH